MLSQSHKMGQLGVRCHDRDAKQVELQLNHILNIPMQALEFNEASWKRDQNECGQDDDEREDPRRGLVSGGLTRMDGSRRVKRQATTV